MIKRLKIALFVPQEIINMRVDRFGVVFLFLLLLSFCLMAPVAIKIARFENVSFDKRLEVQDAFKNKDINYEIINYTLVKTSNEESNDYLVNEQMMITIGLAPESENVSKNLTYRVILSESTVILSYYYRGSKLLSVPIINYSDYEELQNVNLHLAKDANNFDFWNNIFSVTNKVIKQFIPYVTIWIVIGYTIIDLLVMLLIGLLLALFQRISIRRIISFKESYIIACYALAPFAACGLLSELFGVRFIYTIGIALAVIYNLIATNQLLIIRDRR